MRVMKALRRIVQGNVAESMAKCVSKSNMTNEVVIRAMRLKTEEL